MKHKLNRKYHPLQFINVPVGAHFMYRGTEYVKDKPLHAQTEEGKSNIFYPEEYVSEWWYI